MADLSNISIREARDNDAGALITLIGEIFAEYDCVLDLDDLDSELLSIETYINTLGGKFWVAEADGTIVGCVGYAPKSDDLIELKRLYVAKPMRRKGLANKLTDLIYQAADDLSVTLIDCWSDTRFLEAHAFYLKHGFIQQPETRDLNDPSNTTEFQFIKRL